MIQLLENTVTIKLTRQEAVKLTTVLNYYKNHNSNYPSDIGQGLTIADLVAEMLEGMHYAIYAR